MSKLITRTLTGFLFVALIIASVVYDVPPRVILFNVFGFICLYEYFQLVRKIFSNSILKIIASTALGIIYCIIPFYLLNASGNLIFITQYQYELILGFFIILWASDTGAYLVGTAIGKHKLAPKISPKKSIEGLAGGLLTALLAAFIFSKFYTILRLQDWLIVSMVIAIPGVFGDLLESYLKRKANVKDSGNLLPGHGGFLDRFDALLLAAPCYFFYLKYVIC
ncbi:MAG: CDP-archaeol synthase [Bacteroidia bacterium]|nr:phosphatidate cytidylyltransferase [Bacteroidia bacterium]NNC86350.1 CDP-archaeol synthase [Bacteroidia bacterium]NNM15649.1 CDP-archaeol synthase [Bacteroidia bacterium]